VAQFRFYEELNDFLAPALRKSEFPYAFTGTQSVKDAIEAIGVPHTEVDLVLVDGESVDFTRRLTGERTRYTRCSSAWTFRRSPGWARGRSGGPVVLDVHPANLLATCDYWDLTRCTELTTTMPPSSGFRSTSAHHSHPRQRCARLR
jgi:hypothetical protein